MIKKRLNKILFLIKIKNKNKFNGFNSKIFHKNYKVFIYLFINFYHRDLSDELFALSQDKEKLIKDISKLQKILKNIIENLLANENEEENFIDFCENKIIERIIDITYLKEKKINLEIIKWFSLLIPNLKNKKIEYFLFSNNYMNQIICNISYNNVDNDVDYLSFYINFLKTIANKINTNSFHLFFNRNYQRFPLFDEIIIFLTYDKDIMIKNTSRNIFLTLLKLNYKPFIDYICDLPSITLFLLFSENLKQQFKYFCSLKENKRKNSNSMIQVKNDEKEKDNINNLFNEFEERKDMLVDDISFIQDILSVNISKINYLLINSIFYISLKYLFNNILLRQNAEVSFFILNLFLEIIKSQCLKNIIVFILYYSRIQINIIEIVANEELTEIERLLNLNKYTFKNNIEQDNDDKLSFDDYIILNYSSRFLYSLKYIKDSDNIYPELKEISRELNNLDENKNEMKIAIKLLNKKINKINIVLQLMEEYHNFVSKATGINVGVNTNSSCHSFLQIIYNNYNDNYGWQENILKNVCNHYLTNFHLSQYLCTVNEIFLILQIIHDKDISRSLKFSLNLLNSFPDNKENKIININSIDENIDDNSIKNCDIPPLPTFKFNSINSYDKFYENKTKIYKNLFGIEKDDKKNEIYLSSFLSLPNIVDNKNNNINEEIDLNNEFFDKILFNYKSSNELVIIDKLINLLLDSKKTLNKIIYKLCNDIIIDLLYNGNYLCYIDESQTKKINDKYKQLLQIINDLLEKSTIEEQIYNDNYFYEYFENCFNLNKMDIFDIKKKYLNAFIFIINEENLNDYNDKIGLDLIKIPNEKYQILKCLFQKFFALYDLKIILSDKNNKNLLMNYLQFPLYFFDKNNINKIFEEEIKNKYHFKLKYKTNKDTVFEKGIFSVYKNVIILFKYKEITEKELTDNGDIYIFDKLIPLRKVKISEIETKEFDKSKFLILNIIKNDNNNYQLILLSENDLNILKIKDIIMYEIKKAIDIEYLTLKKYFKKLLDDEALNGNVEIK